MKDRVTIKSDTTENWKKAINFIPLKGEPILYTDEENTPKIKIGDGVTNVNELEFVNVRESFVEDGLLIL